MDKSIKVGAINGDGANLNTGDHVNQTVNINVDSKHDELFAKVMDQINSSLEGDDKQDAIDDMSKIKESVGESKKERALKFFKRLPAIIQTCTAGAELLLLIQTIQG